MFRFHIHIIELKAENLYYFFSPPPLEFPLTTPRINCSTKMNTRFRSGSYLGLDFLCFHRNQLGLEQKED